MGHSKKCCLPVHYVFLAGTWHTTLVSMPQALVPSPPTCRLLHFEQLLQAQLQHDLLLCSQAPIAGLVPPPLGAGLSLWEVSDAILAVVLSGTPTGLWMDTRQGLHRSLCGWGRAVSCIQVCMLQSCPILLWPYGLWPVRLRCPWGFSRQEYWSGLPCPPSADLPNQEIEPKSSVSQVDGFFTHWVTWKAWACTIGAV